MTRSTVTPRDDVRRHLTSGELEALRVLVGRRLVTLYAEGLDMCRSSAVAPYFVVRVGAHQLGEFLVIESDWSETQDEAIDYHEMHVSLESTPRQIPWDIDGGEGGTIRWPCSTFNIEPPLEAEKIAVLTHAEEGRREAVDYDAAIILTGTDGRKLAILAHPSIRGGVEVSLDERRVAEVLECGSARVTLP